MSEEPMDPSKLKFEVPGYLYVDACVVNFSDADVHMVFLDRDPFSATGHKVRIGIVMTRPAFEGIVAMISKVADAMKRGGASVAFEMMSVDGKPQ